MTNELELSFVEDYNSIPGRIQVLLRITNKHGVVIDLQLNGAEYEFLRDAGVLFEPHKEKRDV